MNKKWNLVAGLLKTETRALIVGAGLLIVGVLLGVSGAIDGDVAILLAGSVLTVVSIYTTTTAFIRYQWTAFLDDVKNYQAWGKVLMEDALAEQERRKNDKDW